MAACGFPRLGAGCGTTFTAAIPRVGGEGAGAAPAMDALRLDAASRLFRSQ